MSKTIKKNEKENAQLKKKCEQTEVALIDLAEERNTFKKQSEQLKSQKKRLEDLCRTLQGERAKLQQEINTRSTSTTTPPTPSIHNDPLNGTINNSSTIIIPESAPEGLPPNPPDHTFENPIVQ
jgi:uncharacterized protein YhaN